MPIQLLVVHPALYYILVLCRYVCLLAAGDVKPEVREVGLTGLGLSRVQIPPGATPAAYRTAVAKLGLPAPGNIVTYMTHKHKQLTLTADLSRYVV